MNIYKLTGRNIEVTDAMRQYAEDKLAKLDRIFDQIIDGRVVMSYDSNKNAANPAKVEVQVNVPGGIIRAEERGLDTYAAVDLVVDKLERQLRRFKGRIISQRTDTVAIPEQVEAGFPEEPVEEERAPQIARVKSHVLRPMAPEDAAMQMEALGHDFFLFHNIDSGLISVIYLRHDGDYGLIEPRK